MSENREKKGKIPFLQIKENFNNSLCEVETFLCKSNNIFRVFQTRKLIKDITPRKHNQE